MSANNPHANRTADTPTVRAAGVTIENQNINEVASFVAEPCT
jgi:hypothetical protein